METQELLTEFLQLCGDFLVFCQHDDSIGAWETRWIDLPTQLLRRLSYQWEIRHQDVPDKLLQPLDCILTRLVRGFVSSRLYVLCTFDPKTTNGVSGLCGATLAATGGALYYHRPCDDEWDDMLDRPPVTGSKQATVQGKSELWLLLRAFRATGSVVSSFIGCSTHGLPRDKYTQMIEDPRHSIGDNMAMANGRAGEPRVISTLERVTNQRVYDAPFCTIKQARYLGATPDGIIPVDRTGHPACWGMVVMVEGKDPLHKMYDEPPADYICQTHIEMESYMARRTYLIASTPRETKVWLVYFSDEFMFYISWRVQRFFTCLQHGGVGRPDEMSIPNVAFPTKVLSEEHQWRSRKRLFQKLRRERTVNRLPIIKVPEKNQSHRLLPPQIDYELIFHAKYIRYEEEEGSEACADEGPPGQWENLLHAKDMERGAAEWGLTGKTLEFIADCVLFNAIERREEEEATQQQQQQQSGPRRVPCPQEYFEMFGKQYHLV